MRRSLILCVVLTALILGLGAICETANLRLTRRYQQEMLSVGAALDRRDWEQARRGALEILSRWEKERGILQLWVNHTDTDAVTKALGALITSVDFEDELNARLYYNECMENFGHLHHRDAFTLKNIL